MSEHEVTEQQLLLNSNVLNFESDNKFYIFGEFDDTLMINVVPALVSFIEDNNNANEKPDIDFYIRSPGGEAMVLYTLLGLVDQAKALGFNVNTHAYSEAYSCASILAAAGTKGRRFITDRTEHLCHLGETSTGQVLTHTQLTRASGRAEAHFDNVRKLYKKYAKIKNLDKMLSDDLYFIRGQEIIDNGLADHII